MTTKGIGLAVAQYLLQAAEEKPRVVVLARTAAPLQELERRHPGRVQAVAGDLLDAAVARRAVDVAIDSWGRLDGVVLNHGVVSVDRIAESTADEWQRVIAVNLLSQVELVRCVGVGGGSA